jgi:uroporphyrinogen decarboxylase
MNEDKPYYDINYFQSEMGVQMKPKDRVKTALSHQEPDRLPTSLWGGSYGLVDPLYEKLVKEMNLGSPLPPIRSGHTVTHIDDRMLELLGTDTRMVWPGASPSSPTHISEDGAYILDDFGQPWKRTIPYYSATDGLLKDHDTIESIDKYVQWPDIDDPKWLRGVAERAEQLQNSPYFIIGRMVVSHGPFQMACDFRSMENFMMDMMLNPEFAAALLRKTTDLICGLTRNYLLAAGDVLDMIELPGDDYGANENLVISPGLFRKMIRPCLEQLVSSVREIRPDIKIMLHSDGAIGKLIPDFIEIGIDVIHPLEPVSGMDPQKIKAEYGDEICFMGGVDISRAMPGSLEDVRKDVDRCFRDLAPGGGYILAPCNHLQADVPPENVIELYSYTKLAGIY